ncbi:hypothetical protein Tco_0983444, partial [Tanacetum coccineum]
MGIGLSHRDSLVNDGARKVGHSKVFCRKKITSYGHYTMHLLSLVFDLISLTFLYIGALPVAHLILTHGTTSLSLQLQHRRFINTSQQPLVEGVATDVDTCSFEIRVSLLFLDETLRAERVRVKKKCSASALYGSLDGCIQVQCTVVRLGIGNDLGYREVVCEEGDFLGGGEEIFLCGGVGYWVIGGVGGGRGGVKTGQINESSVEAVKAMSQPEVTIAGHCLKLTDIKLTDAKIVREFKRPAGVTEEQMDASSDGDVLVIMDLGADDSLFEAGFAREVVNRVQKLRKKSALEPTDSVETTNQFLPEFYNP